MQLQEAQVIRYKNIIDKLCRAVFGSDIQETQTLATEEYGNSYNMVSEVCHMKGQLAMISPDEFRTRIQNLISMDPIVQEALYQYVMPLVQREVNQIFDNLISEMSMYSKLSDNEKRDLCDFIQASADSAVRNIIAGGDLRVSFRSNY